MRPDADDLTSYQPHTFQPVVPANAGTHSHSFELIRPLWPQLPDHRRRWLWIPDRALAFARLSGMTNADFRFDFQTANSTLLVIASAREPIHRAANSKLDCFVAFAPRNDGGEIFTHIFTISRQTIRRRPCESRDPYSAAWRFGTVADSFCPKKRL